MMSAKQKINIQVTILPTFRKKFVYFCQRFIDEKSGLLSKSC